MLLDGLGVDALENHLDKGSFLRRHFVSEISTVFPLKVELLAFM